MKTSTAYRPALFGFALMLLALRASCAETASPPTTDTPLRRIDAVVPALLVDKTIASVSIARIEHAKLAFVASYGQARPGVRATPATLYNIASMSKPISAEVVLRLAAKGRLSLDEPMFHDWIDPDIANDPRRELLTPRLSLSHRSGFPNWRHETGGRLTFLRAPGEAFGYSGEGFEYMARFVEKKTGQPFERLAQRLVFAPSGMRETAYTRRPWFADRIAVPHDGDGRPLPPQIAEHYIASDEVYSSPRDYARFVIGLMERQGVTAAIAAERARVQTDRKAELCPPPRADDCVDEAGFGLGWETYLVDGHRYLMHTGMDAGTFTLGYFDPVDGNGTLIFTNSSNGPQAVLPILDAIGGEREFVSWLRRLAQ